MKKIIIFCLLSGALTACLAPVPLPRGQAGCDLETATRFVGKPHDQLPVKMINAHKILMLHPNTVTDAMYDPTRLRVNINDTGLITSVTCG